MKALFMLIGPPGCGRDEYAQKLETKKNFIIVDYEKVKDKYFEIITENLKEKKDVIYNAANCSKKNRQELISEIKDFDRNISIHGIRFITSPKICEKNGGDKQLIDIFSKQLNQHTPKIVDGFESLTVLNYDKGKFDVVNFEMSDDFKKIIEEKEQEREK